MLNVNNELAAARVPADATAAMRSEASGCAEWQDILRSYPAAMQDYCRAVMSLLSLDAATFNDGWTKAERARKLCELHREKLFHHRHEHRCLTSISD